jgi:hypothetical protein
VFSINSAFIFFILTLLLCIAIHKILFGIVQFAKLPDDKLNIPELAPDYTYLKYSGLACLLIFFIFFMLFLILNFKSIWIDVITVPITPTPAFYTILITIFLYVIIIRKLVNRLNELFYIGKYLSYQLTNNGIMLKQNNTNYIYLGFDEINSIICYEPGEAFAMYNFILNPYPYNLMDLRGSFNSFLISKNRTDQLYFQTGKIDRPAVYIGSNGPGKSLLIRGPGLFYFLTFDKNDPFDIIEGFHKYLIHI